MRGDFALDSPKRAAAGGRKIAGQLDIRHLKTVNSNDGS